MPTTAKTPAALPILQK